MLSLSLSAIKHPISKSPVLQQESPILDAEFFKPLETSTGVSCTYSEEFYAAFSENSKPTQNHVLAMLVLDYMTIEDKARLPLFNGASKGYIAQVLPAIKEKLALKDTSDESLLTKFHIMNCASQLGYLNHPEIFNFISLNKVSLIGMNLRGAKLNFAALNEADLTGADLSNANLCCAGLKKAKLNSTILTKVNFAKARLWHADFSHAEMSYVNLYEANMFYANLSDANLTGANLNRASLINANLSRANLLNAKMIGTNLTMTNLFAANLDGADLDGTDLSSVTHIE